MESNNLTAEYHSRTLYPLVHWQEVMGESARKAAADGRTISTWIEGIVNPVFWKLCPLMLGLPASRSLWIVNLLFSSVLLGSRDEQDFPHQPQRGHSTASLVLGQGLHPNAVLQKIWHLCAMVKERYALLVSISRANNVL